MTNIDELERLHAAAVHGDDFAELAEHLPGLIAELRALRRAAHFAGRFADEVDTEDDRDMLRAALAKVPK